MVRMPAGYDLPDQETVILDDIAHGESDNIEFKSEVPENKTKFVKTAVAFANGNGGKIFFGVGDDGNITGIPDESVDEMKDSITQSIRDSVSPKFFFSVYSTVVKDENVIVVEVLPGDDTPYYIKSEGAEKGTYIRLNAITERADRGEYAKLVAYGSNLSFDTMVCRTAKVTLEGMNDLAERITGYRDRYKDLVNLQVVKKIPHGYAPNNAYALLTDNPFSDYACIKCVFYIGDDLPTQERSSILAGSIIDQVEKALDFALIHLYNTFTVEGLYRKDHDEIPRDALREAIVNAVMHRDYFLDNASIYVRVFSNRVEIESPGTPYKISLEQALTGRTSERNRSLCQVFRRMHLAERSGNGIRTMRRLCQENGSFPPSFKLDGDRFIVTFPRGKVDPDILVDDDEDAVMSLIKEDGEITQQQISERTGIGLSKVKRITVGLQKKGLLMRGGTRRNGWWMYCNMVSYGKRR